MLLGEGAQEGGDRCVGELTLPVGGCACKLLLIFNSAWANLLVGAGVAVPAGEGRQRVSCWQSSVREILLSVQHWRLWWGRKGDVGSDWAFVAYGDRSAGLAETIGRLTGLRWRHCAGESDSDTRSAK